jgi:hypothetical protein
MTRFFSALKESTKKDIFPPPARSPTCNGAPPKSGATKTQQDKEHKSVIAAKALIASEKKLARDAKKLASRGLKEKKKQLLASCKAKRKAIKAAVLKKKASASVLSTPGSALPELSGDLSALPQEVQACGRPIDPFQWYDIGKLDAESPAQG